MALGGILVGILSVLPELLRPGARPGGRVDLGPPLRRLQAQAGPHHRPGGAGGEEAPPGGGGGGGGPPLGAPHQGVPGAGGQGVDVDAGAGPGGAQHHPPGTTRGSRIRANDGAKDQDHKQVKDQDQDRPVGRPPLLAHVLHEVLPAGGWGVAPPGLLDRAARQGGQHSQVSQLSLLCLASNIMEVKKIENL